MKKNRIQILPEEILSEEVGACIGILLVRLYGVSISEITFNLIREEHFIYSILVIGLLGIFEFGRIYSVKKRMYRHILPCSKYTHLRWMLTTMGLQAIVMNGLSIVGYLMLAWRCGEVISPAGVKELIGASAVGTLIGIIGLGIYMSYRILQKVYQIKWFGMAITIALTGFIVLIGTLAITPWIFLGYGIVMSIIGLKQLEKFELR